MTESPFARIPEVEDKAIEALRNFKYDEACNLIASWTQIISSDPNFLGKYIYLPVMDQIMVQMSKMLLSDRKERVKSQGRVPVVIATEIYLDGGHTRIIEDLIKVNPGALLILTGYWSPLATNRSGVLPFGMKGLPILTLPNDSPEKNIIRLNDICNNIASEIYLLSHQHDVVANVALSSNLNVPVFFIHHSDHRACLGASNSEFVHVDMVPHMYEMCKKFMPEKVEYWPQGISDLGAKNYKYPLDSICTASSGASVKYSWDGFLSYPKMVKNLLSSGIDSHYHIGALSGDKLEAIKFELESNSIEFNRFKYIPRVESLWQTLLDLPINFFIGSAPVHGLRTSLEVQGAGVPILPFIQKNDDFLDEKNLYNKKALFWDDPNEIPKIIANSIFNHKIISTEARTHFLENYSFDLMKNKIYKSLSDKGILR